MADVNENRLRINLSIISKLKQCDRLSTTGENIGIEKKTIVLPVMRFFKGENRYKNIVRLQEVFSIAEKLLNHKLEIEATENASRLISEIRQAREGVMRLKTSTYEMDQLTVARIDILLANIQTFCDKAEGKVLTIMRPAFEKKRL